MDLVLKYSMQTGIACGAMETAVKHLRAGGPDSALIAELILSTALKIISDMDELEASKAT